jgi:predicted anti-sigma-YlaC factor YlaD
MAMSEHDKIRELLPLAAAGALTSAEEKQVAEHMRSCIACSNELEAWWPIASELRRLPTPQPSSWLVQATLARAQAKLAEQAEHDWNRRVMIALVAFAWLLTIASWPVFHFVSGRFGSLLGPQFSPTQFGQTQFAQTWISFAAFTALGWLAGGVAAVMLAIRQRGERRLA